MAKKVSKKEYKKWISRKYNEFLGDMNVNFTRVLNRCALVDFISKKTVFYDSDNNEYGSHECVVKAYANLKGFEIPTVEGTEETLKVKEIYLVEYCENFDDDSPFILQGAFATEELAAAFIDEKPNPENYYTSKTDYYE